jgi:hypothetical protein
MMPAVCTAAAAAALWVFFDTEFLSVGDYNKA